MILADGAREDVFRRLLEEGKLPHIQKEIVERGSYAKGVTVFPSTTGPAYFPFLTGHHPGTLNVPGIRWFDKEAYANSKKKMVKFRSYVGIETFLINSDIKPVPTVFDLLPQSFSIFNSVCPGAGPPQPHQNHADLVLVLCPSDRPLGIFGSAGVGQNIAGH